MGHQCTPRVLSADWASRLHWSTKTLVSAFVPPHELPPPLVGSRLGESEDVEPGAFGVGADVRPFLRVPLEFCVPLGERAVERISRSASCCRRGVDRQALSNG